MHYACESWAQFYPDFLPIWQQEHAPEVHPPEIGPARIDTRAYEACERAGQLALVTVRASEAGLVGYHVAICVPHINFCDIVTAFVSLYYIRQPLRGLGLGRAMLEYATENLQARGVRLMLTGAKTALPYAAVFRHLGWCDHETLLMRWL